MFLAVWYSSGMPGRHAPNPDSPFISIFSGKVGGSTHFVPCPLDPRRLSGQVGLTSLNLTDSISYPTPVLYVGNHPSTETHDLQWLQLV